MRVLLLALLAACTGHVVVLDSQPEPEGVELQIDRIYDCNLDHVACDVAAPQCKDGEVPSVEGLCYGPCVSPLMCK